jgi:predicted nucleic acid-binding protein
MGTYEIKEDQDIAAELLKSIKEKSDELNELLLEARRLKLRVTIAPYNTESAYQTTGIRVNVFKETKVL